VVSQSAGDPQALRGYQQLQPRREPFKDNVVFVGDSVWFAEAENTGALLSGHKAAHAVSKALHTGQINREGGN